MEITKSEQKEMNTLNTYSANTVQVPYAYSRSKAIKFAKNEGGSPVPERIATKLLYAMFMKIGATNELPQEKHLKDSYLNDFWIDLYFNNHLCPGDIPFQIIIKSFTTALVQGVADRKGNNQAAICQAFNKWITKDSVRHSLYLKRDELYPSRKPKQISKNATPETISDYSDEDLIRKINQIKPMSGINMVDQMMDKLKEEAYSRGLLQQKEHEL